MGKYICICLKTSPKQGLPVFKENNRVTNFFFRKTGERDSDFSDPVRGFFRVFRLIGNIKIWENNILDGIPC